ncbi:MAG TPA: hypothetical protein VFI12_01345 [Thermomicrobiales bacterium]|jgi:hypothetical protein|nr:hypothetical protein [Thermomicrobiales bacterium]
MLTGSLVLLGISLLWLAVIIIHGLRCNARERAAEQPREPVTPIQRPVACGDVLHPPPDLYRPGHAAERHRVA